MADKTRRVEPARRIPTTKQAKMDSPTHAAHWCGQHHERCQRSKLRSVREVATQPSKSTSEPETNSTSMPANTEYSFRCYKLQTSTRPRTQTYIGMTGNFKANDFKTQRHRWIANGREVVSQSKQPSLQWAVSYIQARPRRRLRARDEWYQASGAHTLCL